MRICDDDILKMDYLTGDLEPERREIVQQHLADCPACRDELADLQMLTGKLNDLPQPECPQELAQKTQACLAEYERLHSKFRVKRLAVSSCLMAVTGLVAAFIVNEFGILSRCQSWLSSQVDKLPIIESPSFLQTADDMSGDVVPAGLIICGLLLMSSLLDGLGLLKIHRQSRRA